MTQPDLFQTNAPCSISETKAHLHDRSSPNFIPAAPSDLPAILERLAATCDRPRYSFMVLNLIAQASARTGHAGPWIDLGSERLAVRDWLSRALSPVARREHQRTAMMARAARDLAAAGQLPKDPAQRDSAIAEEMERRLLHSRRTNVSRAVSELVRAGLVQRHYHGYRVDHVNRGAQRQAVYTIRQEVRLALQRGVTARC